MNALLQRLGDSEPLMSGALSAHHGDPVAASVNERLALASLRGITKRFGSVCALQDVSVAFQPGEVHVLLGENGAGKSSLIKILAGIHKPDAGTVEVGGQAVHFRGPGDAKACGISVIHQELALVPHLSVTENICLGHESTKPFFGYIDRKAQRRRAEEALRLVGFVHDPDQEIASLSTAKQQMVEIARALSHDARILVMDEPTASISDRECENLFSVIRSLRAKGVAIIYISHRMREVFELADRISVLRDGCLITTTTPGEVSPQGLIAAMVGRAVGMVYERTSRQVPGPVVLEATGVCTTAGIENISITVRAGEVVGLAGLVGSGRTEVARAIVGADRITAGSLRLFGDDYVPSPVGAAKRGIAFIPESRKEQGLAIGKSLCDNALLPGLSRLFRSGFLSRGRGGAVAAALVKQLHIKTPSVRAPVGNLSGGNQQKVVIAKWLPLGSRLVIIDEPTRGIDVGAKAEIFHVLEQLLEQGCAVLMISSELPEVVGFCDRVYVMQEKRVRGELAGPEISEQSIMELAVAHDD